MSRRRKPNEDFHYVDVHVGKRLRRRREELAISRQRLGQAACVVHQQVEKYEGAINRVSPGCLYRFARLLNVPVIYFFEGLAPTAIPSSSLLDTMVLPFSSGKPGISSRLITRSATPAAAAPSIT